ncbi:MAG: TonB-dependent receptor [Bacteroidota bacterium]
MTRIARMRYTSLLFFCFVGYLCPPYLLFSQNESILIRQSYHGRPFQIFIEQLEQKYPLRFYYAQTWIDSLTVVQVENPMPLTKILLATFESTELSYYQDELGRIFITRDFPIVIAIETSPPGPAGSPSADQGRQQQSFVPDIAPPLVPSQTESPGRKAAKEKQDQDVVKEIGEKSDESRTRGTIVGYVKDEATGEPLIAASIFVAKLSVGVTTDQYGYYSLTLPKGPHTLGFRSYGKEEKTQDILLVGDGVLDIELEPTIIQLDEVVIESERDANIESTQMGLAKLDIQTMKQMPSFMGEIDVIKSTLLLPGVQSVGEGTSGFNVRGGSVDQNLILINQAPIFNSSHLFGFFSVFNPDVIKNFDLYKSGIPAKYGGRISSVLDIAMKDGNKRELVGSGGISPVTARLTLEGPIRKNRSSFILGGRSSYSDWILKRLPSAELRNSKAGFSDLNGKINLELSDKDRLDVSVYASRDQFVLNGDTTYRYHNLNGSVNWKHLFNNKLYAVSSAIASQYRYRIESSAQAETAYRLTYGIRYQELKSDITYIPQPNHQIRFGASSILYQLNPGERLPNHSESLVMPTALQEEQALESGIYLSDEWTVGPRLKLYGGLRYSLYLFLGPHSINQYRDDLPRIADNITGSIPYEAGRIVKPYGGPEIRFSARLALGTRSSLKLSYNRLRQYLHMLSNTTSISPSDSWKLSDPYIRPQIGDQLSVGFYQNFRQNSIETSIEVYVKRIKDMLEFKNGAQLLLNPHVETDIVNGLGRAYGAEFLIKKERGKLNGWISYTYSRVFSQVNGQFPDEIINGGEPFPANVDKPHDFSFVGNYKFSRRFSMSSNIAYSTGRPITYPVSQFVFGNTTRLDYSLRNQYRIPDYFRWDFSLNIEGNHKIKKFAHTSWSLSVFNVLGRKNVYSIYFVSEPTGVQGYKLSVFGRPIMTLTFNFRI